MKTKIIDETVHLKERKYIFLEGEIKPTKQIRGKLMIVENEGITYVVLPIDSKRRYEGLMLPIIENYDSLEEIK